MTPGRWAQIRRIFDEALERPQSDRGAYLAVACGDDPDLRREVESLLSSHDDSATFLNTPAVELQQALAAFEDSTGEIPQIPRVGPYQLERRLGRGGMGAVWLASRIDREYEKKVAVKMVRRGMDTQEILRRFRMERQVLAGLDHPNIARLIDGGSTPDGLPYLVMEYVEGIAIDHYCESRKSSISERLRLFRDVCAAVQYAHQNLVVHRDIKSGNILVTPEGAPKLLDFGIAKLLRSEVSITAAFDTRPELRPMTLDYASPEQVRGDPITTASDVYSLGVLLYKLLTGKFPYGPDAKSRAALQQAILEREPLRPSAVVLSDQQSAIPAATQKIEVGAETRDKARRRLKRKLSGDLDTILLKALRKEPARRYASVEQFSADIRRYLEGKPVIARGGALGYRASKFLRRNAASVAVAGTALVLLVAATVSSVVTVRRTREALAESRQRELAMAPALVRAYDRLGDLYAPADPARAAAEYQQAVETARAFLREHPERTDLRPDLGWAWMKLGDIFKDRAPEYYTNSLTQFEAAAQAAPRDSSRQKDVAAVARRLGLAQLRQGDRSAALASFGRALQIGEGLSILESGPGKTPGEDTRILTAECNFDLGQALAASGQTDAAAAKLRRSLDLYGDLYRDLAGQPAGITPADGSAGAFTRALEGVAAKAPLDLRKSIQAELAFWK